MGVLRTIGPVARGQHGLITTEQLRHAGISPGQQRWLVVDGALVAIRTSVYRMAGVAPTWQQSALAAVLAAGPGAVASHATAAALWDLQAVDRHPSGPLHVTAPRRIRMTGVSAHRQLLPPGFLRTRRGIPVTSAERTIFDLSGSLAAGELGGCVDDALRRRLIRLERLRRLVEEASGRGRRPTRALRQVLADRIPGYDPGGSDSERRMDRLWDRLGLPPAERQYAVSAGGHRYVLDRAIPDLKIGVEWNGFGTHGSRSGFDHDSDRRADLTAAGWHMVDFTSRSSPDRLVAAVTGAIAARQTAGD
jgi:hypothetical protein